MSEEAPHLITREEDGILIATLNRPEKLNALSAETLELLEEAVLRFRDTPDLMVMLIRATGRFFSAGADLKGGESTKRVPTSKTASGIRENHRLNLNGMHRLYDEMEHIEKPIVVAHQAMCMGGGLELSLSCDFRLAARSAGYAFPESKFGSLPASNGVSRLTRIVGVHWARWLVMANKPMSADQALNAGLIHQVIPDETFEEEVMAFCRHLTGNSGEQMGAAKLAIEMAYDLNRDQGRNVERMANAALMLNPDYGDLMARHLSKVGKGTGGN